MAIRNLSVLIDNEGRQVAVVKESAKEVTRVKPDGDWYVFQAASDREIYVHKSLMANISVINEIQAVDDSQPQNGKILVAQANPPADILHRSN